MLDDFIRENRETILERSRQRVRARLGSEPTEVEMTSGIPTFLVQLGDVLRQGQDSAAFSSQQLARSAGEHGRELFRLGLSVGQVVHDYGDVCQVITELAIQQGAPISGLEFRQLNLCLDDAIAGAVTEYASQREHALSAQDTERLGVFAHELRNLLNTATLAFESIQSGRVAVSGSTGMVLGRSLMGLRNLVDHSLASVRLDADLARPETILVADLLGEIEIGATMQAQARGLRFSATPVSNTVAIKGDRQSLLAALANLLQNAFKFTHKDGRVSLTTRVTAARVLFEIEDECGGLPPGSTDKMFRPFSQFGNDLSGVGLGLSICLKAAHANHGEIQVRDLAGKGCIFTLSLPRLPALPITGDC